MTSNYYHFPLLAKPRFDVKGNLAPKPGLITKTEKKKKKRNSTSAAFLLRFTLEVKLFFFPFSIGLDTKSIVIIVLVSIGVLCALAVAIAIGWWYLRTHRKPSAPLWTVELSTRNEDFDFALLDPVTDQPHEDNEERVEETDVSEESRYCAYI